MPAYEFDLDDDTCEGEDDEQEPDLVIYAPCKSAGIAIPPS